MSEVMILDENDPRQYVQDILSDAIRGDTSSKPHHVNDYFVVGRKASGRSLTSFALTYAGTAWEHYYSNMKNNLNLKPDNYVIQN